MKKFYPVIILLLLGCKKQQPETSPVHFTSTTYQFLGTWDSTSKPNYLSAREVISNDLLDFLKTTLPEATNLQKAHPELLSSKAISDIALTNPSDVYITFVSQGANMGNAFAFYTYPTNSPPTSAKDIKTITYIFPNAGHLTPLSGGEQVKIGSFEPGTSIGFVLMQDAWIDSTKTLNNDAVHFCSNDVLNPETNPSLKKHAVIIDYNKNNDHKVLIGYEDIDRTRDGCDNDFNDLVVYATVTPH